MESAESEATSRAQTIQKSLCYARLAGRILGLGLILWSIFLFFLNANLAGFGSFKATYCLLFGIILQIPFRILRTKMWKVSFVALTVLAAGFVFVMIISVMFDYMASAERGERLGVPGLEGTLIFLSLLQPPIVLFRQNPDLLD
ncbi:MAG: hypothetical protein VYE55_01740 [Verrucomicrobiota bacterium]|nr:hypothetical protein [Verrucomicrobiota bacterium]MEC8405053.1 hypothetical protein [Verrucomicrobiota bacterium]